MRTSLQTKFFLGFVMLILVMTIGISATYYTLTKRDKQRESRQRIQIAFDILLKIFEERSARAKQQVEELLRTNAKIGNLLYLYGQEGGGASKRAIGVYLLNIVNELQQFARVAFPDRLLLYDADQHLVLAYRRTPAAETIGGYVVSEAGAPTYLPLDDPDVRGKLLLGNAVIPDAPLPESLAAYAATVAVDGIRVAEMRDGPRVGIRITAAVTMAGERVGTLLSDVFYTQHLIEQYATLTQTDINIFADRIFSVGTLPAQDRLERPPDAPTAMCHDLLTRQQGVRIVSYVVGVQRYYQGQCVFENTEEVIGALTINLSQSIEQQAIRQNLTAILGMSGIMLVAAFGLALLLSSRIAHPIQQLSRRLCRISEGDLAETEEPLANMTRQRSARGSWWGDDEIAVLSASFSAMVTYLQTMTAAAEHISQGDFAWAIAPRSSRDTLGRAFQTMSADLKETLDEMHRLVRSVEGGDLTMRGNVERFSGGWRDLMAGLNHVIDTFLEVSTLIERLKMENLRMGAELHVVKQLQQMVLPRPEELTQIPGLDIVGYMQPADEVGGDYYDVLQNGGILHIGIGDVTGHGLESGVLMLMTQAAIRTLIEHGETDPVKFVNTLNRLIYKNAARIGSDKNLTFALAQYQQGQLKLVGQHEEVLVVRQGGQIERVNTMNLGFPVGLEPEISQWVHAVTMTLQPGDGLVLYTDGITEAENTTHDHYGLDRLCAVLSQQWAHSAEAIKQAVVADVFAFIGTQKVYDDLTLVILKQE